MGRLSGKRALITGGTTGIGLATAKLFVAEEARLVVTGLDSGRLEDAKAELGTSVACIRADAAQVSHAAVVAGAVREHLGGLDIVFLNAGIARFAPLADVTESFFDEQFDVNVKGVLFTAQAILPLMTSGGSIVVNTSVNNRMGMPGTLVYAASKAAARSLVRVLASECASQGIRVNAVSPGPVQTPIFGKLGLPPNDVQAIAGSLIQKIPLGRFGTADEIAKAVLFLGCDDSSFVTGAELVADGGWTEIIP